jgi:HD-like signal output (HDOD) protein
MAIGITVMSFCPHAPEELLDMKAFWMHSIGCGIICKNMMKRVDGADAEHLYLAGLLHDIGYLFMLQEKPTLVQAAWRLSETEECSLHEAEKAIFGFNHCELGSKLMSLWNFPPFLVESVRCHHNLQGDNTETCVVHVADAVAHAAFSGSSCSLRLPELATRKWDRFRLNPQKMGQILTGSVSQYQDLVEIFI